MTGLVAKAKDIYETLPLGVRGAAASMYGWYLRWWRYGPDTDRLVEEALARDAWSEAQWRAYREERLGTLLGRAATRVPYYRETWAARRAAGDRASWDRLENWPVLTKAELQRDPRAFLADDVDPRRLFRLSTSGTSGTPVTTWRSRTTMQAWYALFEARARRWYGVDRQLPWAILGGQVVVPEHRSEPPFWVWNGGLRQLYLSNLHLSERNVGAYLAAIERHGVEHMFGYASSLYWLAAMARAQDLDTPTLRVVVSNAEPLHRHQRALIEEVFRCPVRDTYGMAEIVAAASECDHGEMHVWPDAGFIEVMDDGADEPLRPGSAGRLICTGLLNDAMPLIRYEVGDRGALRAPDAAPCRCGVALPRLERIEGRTSDNLLTVDGRRIFWINPIFYDLPVREAQVVQTSIDTIRVLLVVDVDDPAVHRTIESRLRQRLGSSVHVEVQRVSEIPRAANGKFKPVVNLVDAA